MLLHQKFDKSSKCIWLDCRHISSLALVSARYFPNVICILKKPHNSQYHSAGSRIYSPTFPNNQIQFSSESYYERLRLSNAGQQGRGGELLAASRTAMWRSLLNLLKLYVFFSTSYLKRNGVLLICADQIYKYNRTGMVKVKDDLE